MDVKDARAELVDIRHRIDELADQMARIPLQAKVLAFGFIENPFPDGGLAEHVVVHDRQMIRALRAMLESDPHPALGGELRQRLPKCQELRQIILERLVNRVAAALEKLRFNHGARKARYGRDSDMRRHFDGSLKDLAREVGLPRVERILVERANGRNAKAALPGFGR